MKLIKLYFICLITTSSYSQLSNNIPSYGPVSIGTDTPEAGKQLTVNGSSKFVNSVELDSDLFIDGQTVMKSIVRMDALATYAGLPEDMEILIRDPYGQVTRTTRTYLVAALMSPVGLDYCEAGDVASPQWFAGLNKLFSPCPTVNVGIGTDAPDYKLDVRGTTFSLKIKVGNATGSEPAMINAYAYNHSQSLLRLGKKIGGLAEEVRFTVDNDGAVIMTNAGDNPAITINNGSGHAIVVNNNSGEKIVQIENTGLVRSRSVRVDLADWADHVFAKDYNLMSLKDIKKFIENNGHLPEVPSEKELETTGLDLGEMQKIQMQKIEELTLHLISMSEQMEEMQNRLNELEAENNALKSK